MHPMAVLCRRCGSLLCELSRDTLKFREGSLLGTFEVLSRYDWDLDKTVKPCGGALTVSLSVWHNS